MSNISNTIIIIVFKVRATAGVSRRRENQCQGHQFNIQRFHIFLILDETHLMASVHYIVTYQKYTFTAVLSPSTSNWPIPTRETEKRKTR